MAPSGGRRAARSASASRETAPGAPAGAPREAPSSRREFEDIINRSPTVVLVIRCEEGWPIVYMSNNVARYGYSPEAFTSGRLRGGDVIHPDDRARVWQDSVRRRAEGATEYRQEYRFLTSWGETRWVEDFTRVQRDAHGRDTFMECILQDVTERCRADEARRLLESRMSRAERLEDVGTLAAGMAHDFNNLLTAIIGNLDLASDGLGAGAPVAHNLSVAGAAARRAANLCQQLLACTREPTAPSEDVPLAPLVEEILTILRSSQAATTSLRCELARDLPPVRGDPTGLRQIVMNLVINARESLGSGGGEVVVATGLADREEVARARFLGDPKAERRSHGPFACLEVRDTGCGMDEATRAHMFEPLHSTKMTGRGLGLAVVAGIVRAHLGAVLVESELAAGTRFRVFLPLARA